MEDLNEELDTRTLDAKLKTRMLRPLTRRSRQSLSQASVDRAIDVLHAQGEAGTRIVQLREWMYPDGIEKGAVIRESPEDFLRLTNALHEAGRITTAELVLYADFVVEQQVEEYRLEKKYDHLTAPIEQQMDAIREEYGLGEDDYWLRSEEPKEYRALNAALEGVFRQAAISVLREFGFEQLASLRQQSEKEYAKLRERGRRKLFHGHEFVRALRDLVIRYEQDAERAATASAFYAAITLLGAAVEGLLILRCLRAPQKAKRTAQQLPRKRRPASNQEPQDWRFAVLIEVCAAAGWLPVQHVEWGGYKLHGLADAIRQLRNFIHPAVHARDRPWVEVDAHQYADAHAMYTLIRQELLKKKGQSKE